MRGLLQCRPVGEDQDAAVVVYQARGQSEVGEPARGGFTASHSSGGRDAGIHARDRGDAYRAPAGLRGLAEPGIAEPGIDEPRIDEPRIDMAVQFRARPDPAVYRRARRGESALCDADGAAGSGGVADCRLLRRTVAGTVARVVGHAHPPAAIRGLTLDGEVVTEAHQYTAAGCSVCGIRGAVRRQGLCGSAEVEQ